MRCVLGLDGGGTKTDCVLMNETGAVLARTRSRPSNPVLVGVEVAVAVLVEGSEEAFEKAGLEHRDVRRISGGITGIGGSSAHAQPARQRTPTFLDEVVLLVTDSSMALSATQEIPSAAAIADTASAIFGRRAADETACEVFGRSGYFDDPFARSVRSAAPLARIDGRSQPVAEFAARCAVNCLDRPVRRVGS